MATETNKFLNIIETVYKTTGGAASNQQLKASAEVVKQLAQALRGNVTVLKSLTPSISNPFSTLGNKVELLTFAFQKTNGEIKKMELYINAVNGEIVRMKSISPTSLPRTSPLISGNFPNQAPSSFSDFLKTNSSSIPIMSVGEQIRQEMPRAFDYKSLAEGYGKTSEAAIKLGKSHKQASSELGKMAKRAVEIVPIWMTIRTIYQSFIQLLQNSFKFLVEWETVMSKIAVVGGGTREELKKLSKDLLQLGTAYGVSVNDLGEGARLWAQQGKNYSEIIPLMKTTTELSIITGRSVKDSVEDLTTVMYSFGLQADDTRKIVDALVAIDLKFAITTDVMVEALRKVGPVASQMGLSLEKTLGIIAATHLATRAKGGEIGNALKTIFTRLETVSRDSIQSLADVPVFLDSMNQATKENTGNFRDWGTIFDEIAQKYDELAKTNKSVAEDLAFELSGTRQITKLKAAFAQWNEALKATSEALNSEGASQRAVNILLDTADVKARRLTGAWNELVATVADTKGWKGLLDVLREIILEMKRVEEFKPGTLLSAGPLILSGGAGKVLADYALSLRNKKPNKEDDATTKEVKKQFLEHKKIAQAKIDGKFLDKDIQDIELARLDTLKDYGVEDSEIARRKLEYLNKFTIYNDKDIVQTKKKLASEIETLSLKDKYTNFLLKEELVAKRLEGLGYNRIQIAIAELARKEAYLKAQNVDISNNKEIIQQRQKILELVQEEINTYSKSLQDTLTGGLTDFLKGEKTLGKFGEGVASSIQDSVLSAFTGGAIEKVFQSTGLGKIFGSSIFDIKHLFDKTPKNIGDLIYDSHVRGIKDGFAQADLSKSLSRATGTSGNLIEGILGLINSGFSTTPKWLTGKAASRTGGIQGAQNTVLGSLGNILGGVGNVALTGYSAYQSAGGGGLGAFAGALGGIGSIASMIPGGQTVGGLLTVGSMLFGLFKKQKESVDKQTQTVEELKEISSKIQVSNKELSVVNRNLIAIRQEKTFILPESAYFSTKSNIDDEFSLHASRGLI